MPIRKGIEEWVHLGPAILEQEFQKISVVSNENKYIAYLKTLQKQSTKTPAILTFLRAYFYQQIGKKEHTPIEKEVHFKRALENYQDFIDSHKKGNPDISYFAQWQIGVLQESLGVPWPIVEESYLKAQELDVSRGEALNDILAQRYNNGEWRIAHIYSSFCMKQYMGRRPSGKYWGINNGFYDWKILGYHIFILIAIRRKEEAIDCLKELISLQKWNLANLSESELLEISRVQNAIEGVLLAEK